MAILYNQGTQRIEIIVKKSSTGNLGNKDKPTDKVSSQDSNENQEQESSGGMSQRGRRILVTNLTHTLATAKQIAELAIEYRISGYGDQNGDQAYQQQISRRVEQFKDTTNLASNIARGAIFGAWGGPVGMLVGATLGAATTGASLISKYKTRQRDYDYKIFKEENAIEYNRARAGINLTNGRLR